MSEPAKQLPSGKKPGKGRFEPGFDPRRNRTPPPPGPGRPRNEFLERMRALATKAHVPEEILAEIPPDTRNKLLHEHPLVWIQVMALRLRAWIEAADRGYNRPAAVQTETDEAERRFVEGVPILDINEWRKKFAARNAP